MKKSAEILKSIVDKPKIKYHEKVLISKPDSKNWINTDNGIFLSFIQ